VQSIAIGVCVCVCLSVSVLASQKSHVQSLPNYLYMLPVAVTLYTSGFVDDVMLSHYGANGTESKSRPVHPPDKLDEI